MQDRRGDLGHDFEAWAIALADGHPAEEILDATSRFPQMGENCHHPHIPTLAKVLTSRTPPAPIAARKPRQPG